MTGDVKRVCLLGAESTGKTTLAAALAERFDTVWNPEYGRTYTQLGRPADAPWTRWEFTHIARIQCWYEDFLAGLAHVVLFTDTDAFTTAVFHEVYLGTPATGFDELVRRPYDLFVVCGLDVPWRVTIHHPGGFGKELTLAVTGDYFDVYEEQGFRPEPAETTRDGDTLFLTFTAPLGDTFVVDYDAYVQPSAQRGRDGSISVMDGGDRVATVDFDTRLLP